MTYGVFLINNPLFWSAVAGLSIGGALATATRSVKNERNPDRARSRKWTASALWATVGVVAATCGILIPEGTGFVTFPALYVGAGALGFFCLALRFPRAGGIPAFLILAIIAVAGPFVVRAFVPVRDAGVVATVRLIAVDETGVYVEIDDRTPGTGETPRVIISDTSTVVAHGYWLEISDYLFFLGAQGGARFLSLTSEVEGETGAGGVAASSGDSVAGTDGAPVFPDTPLVEWIIQRTPLLTLSPAQSPPARLGLLKEYAVVCTPGGEFRIVPATAAE